MKFIVCTPAYDENSGGAIVLHKLCAVLNENGHTALLWPANRPRNQWQNLRQYLRVLAFYASRVYRPRFALKKGDKSSLATSRDIRDAIVVYPETIEGNPLRTERYVRWLLHKPGFLLGKSVCKEGELYFCFKSVFNVGCENMVYGGLLTVVDVLRGVYVKTNGGERKDICYMIRKGNKRSDLPRIPKGLVVDGFDHTELARVFNAHKYCYFYDPYTMYARYAALCGCVPIIIPLPGVTKEAWISEEDARYGLAYGDEDIEFAERTRDLLISKLDALESQNGESVNHFVGVVERHFSIE